MGSLSARQLVILLAGWRDVGVAYTALADRIRLLVLDGRVATGTRLPAERELAAQLEVSRTTVTAAYAELRDAGYLSSVRGSGSVAQLPFKAIAAIEPMPGYLDFSKATMPAIPGVVAAAREAADLLPAYLGDSGFDPVGIPVLREALADRYTSRGLPTTPDQIMVTIGAQHAIALIARTIMARGDRALIENPTYPHALDALKAAGARIAPVSVTSEGGWDEEALEQVIQRTSPSLGYLMPDYHNPTGASMPDDVRERVLGLAARHGTTLVADETMGELGFDGPVRTLPFAALGSAITIGSVGKSVWGGVRIGWIRADRTVIQRLIRERTSGDLGTPLLEQLIVTNLLRDYDAILDSRRAYLRAGRDHLERQLAAKLPEWSVPRVNGGLTAWINLGHPVSSQLALAARNEGLIITAGPRFGMDGAFERFVRIPFSHSAEETERAVDALARAWAAVGRHPMPETSADLSSSVV
ncbi:MAG: PLP-dependent aminotransferase family protein [Microbacteriaceae bacterium]|nr:PLP-dependent aminotransferase family protein [Microbacteriaceae bacterium]